MTVGYRGYPTVVNYSIRYETPSDHFFAQYEVLTGYMPGAFSKVYAVHAGKAVAASSLPGPPAAPWPIILARDDSCALGVVAHASPRGGRWPNQPWYQPWYGTSTQSGKAPSGTSVPLRKWNVKWHDGSPNNPEGAPIAKSVAFEVALVLGGVDTCASVIAALLAG